MSITITHSQTLVRTRRTIEMGGKHIEVSELHTPLTFVRKPRSLAEVINPFAHLHPSLRHLPPPPAEGIALITETRSMTPSEYDAFTAHLLASREWLDGKGGHPGNGYPDEACLCVEVTAPGRPTLLINPEFYGYPRYVAVLA